MHMIKRSERHIRFGAKIHHINSLKFRKVIVPKFVCKKLFPKETYHILAFNYAWVDLGNALLRLITRT